MEKNGLLGIISLVALGYDVIAIASLIHTFQNGLSPPPMAGYTVIGNCRIPSAAGVNSTYRSECYNAHYDNIRIGYGEEASCFIPFNSNSEMAIENSTVWLFCEHTTLPPVVGNCQIPSSVKPNATYLAECNNPNYDNLNIFYGVIGNNCILPYSDNGRVILITNSTVQTACGIASSAVSSNTSPQ